MGDLLYLYTQDNCKHCDLLKSKLEEYGMIYILYNISEDANAKEYLRNMGHKTVPQLYFRNYHLSAIPTEDITEEYLEMKIGEAI